MWIAVEYGHVECGQLWNVDSCGMWIGVECGQLWICVECGQMWSMDRCDCHTSSRDDSYKRLATNNTKTGRIALIFYLFSHDGYICT